MTDKPYRVGVIGALGRMGTQVRDAVTRAADMELAAALDVDDPMSRLTESAVDVVVDFTRPDAVMDHVRFAVESSIPCVVGTSGVSDDRLDTIRGWLGDHPRACVMVVPNFAIGAVLAMRFARDAARFFSSAEIIEMHHAGKVDAPSGTAVSAAAQVAEARADAGLGDPPDATTTDPDGARGASVEGIHVHAVRMPGMVAHLQMLFGNEGETLTIRHDSISRDSFMPGVLTAIREVGDRPGLTVGLEPLLDG